MVPDKLNKSNVTLKGNISTIATLEYNKYFVFLKMTYNLFPDQKLTD